MVAGTPAVEGRTSWGRAALLLVPGLIVVGVLAVAMAQGAIAASFGVAGSQVKVNFGELKGGNITGYAGTSTTVKNGSEPLVLLGLENASGKDLCLSTVLSVPVIGDLSLQVTAGQQTPIEVSSVTANATELLLGNGVLSKAQIGRDGSTLDQNGLLRGPRGSWGIQAGGLDAQQVHLTAWNANAATLRLNGLGLAVKGGKHECY